MIHCETGECGHNLNLLLLTTLWLLPNSSKLFKNRLDHTSYAKCSQKIRVGIQCQIKGSSDLRHVSRASKYLDGLTAGYCETMELLG